MDPLDKIRGPPGSLDIDIVIYHSPCVDGVMSRFIAEHYFRSHNKDVDKVVWHPSAISTPPPNNIDGKSVLICDFSYKKDQITLILKKVRKLLIIDHHKTAEEELRELPQENKIFDMHKSGAGLTWEYFYGTSTPMPLVVQYVQDHDLWTKKLDKANEFASWFYKLPQTYELYSKYLASDEVFMQDFAQGGSSFSQVDEYYINEAVAYSKSPLFMRLPKDGRNLGNYYFVAHKNTSILPSEIANRLFRKHVFSDFSVAFQVDTNSTNFSLRSEDDRTDVSEIAKVLGGGGHRNASGARVYHCMDHLPGIVIDDGKLYKQLFSDKNRLIKALTICEVGTYSVVYLYSPTWQYELATYLLQYKYIDKSLSQNVLVYEDILNRLMEDNGSPSTMASKSVWKQCRISAVWKYDPIENVTKFTIAFDKEMKDQEKKDFATLLKCGDAGTISYSGLQRELNPDLDPLVL